MRNSNRDAGEGDHGEVGYVLGTDDAELVRLARQHELWRREAQAHWQRAGFSAGQAVLDLGCGPGFASFDLAALVGPSGHVIGLDRSQRYIEHARQVMERERADRVGRLAPVAFDVGEADRLTLADGSLDGAYARWVFTFIAEPEAVVTELARALRPGGVLAIQDYFHWPAHLWGPRHDTFDEIVEAIVAAYRARQAVHSAGRYLPEVLVKCGLEVSELEPIVKIVRPDMPLWEWPTSFLGTFLPRLVEMGLLAPETFSAWQAEWAANAADPAGLFMTPPQVAIVARKPL